jgi:FecR protein
LFLGALFLFPGMAFAQEKPVGKVIGISGMIEYFSGTSTPIAEAKPGEVRSASFEPWQKVKFQQPVYSKDRYRTSPKSRLKILFDDKSLIALGPNSEFKVESYIYDREQKLRQGVLRMVNGLSMYLINKSQKNKKSSFRIVTPTANVASRGTHGYLSVMAAMTFVANQAGEVGTGNVKHGICDETKVVGAGEGNKIPKDGCPTTAEKLTKDQFYAISNIVLGEIVATSTGTGSGNKPLITIEEGGVKEGGSEEAGTPEAGSSTGGASETGVPTGGGVEGFGADFLASVEPIAELFEPINEPFNPADLNTCSQ